MKIAICDDDIKDIEIIRNHINEYDKNHEIIEFTSTKPFLTRLYDGERFDILFLDVQMPDSSGWEIAKELKASKVKIFIAMTTIMGKYIYDCFDRVDWFVQKPVSMESVHKIIDKAYEKLYPKVYAFQVDNIIVTLTAPEIIYVEVKINDLYIHTLNRCHKIRLTLKEFEKQLSGMNCFVRIHQSFIINLSYFDRIEKNEIVIKTGSALPLSRKYRNMFYDALEEYIRSD